MREIEQAIMASGWTQAVAARRCGVSQPRINDLLRGHIDRFSVDALVNIATALGYKVQISVKAA
jgi:predicted XRE-type DNA-binding protein